MNKVAKFFHELLTPHCQHCADERKAERDEQREQAILRAQLEEQNNRCGSCESLERENARLVRENERLLNLLLEKPEVPTEKVTDVRDLKPIQTTKVPFVPTAVRRQILEQESRAAANIQRNAPKPDAPVVKVDEELVALEKELNDVQSQREGQTKVVNQ